MNRSAPAGRPRQLSQANSHHPECRDSAFRAATDSSDLTASSYRFWSIKSGTLTSTTSRGGGGGFDLTAAAISCSASAGFASRRNRSALSRCQKPARPASVGGWSSNARASASRDRRPARAGRVEIGAIGQHFGQPEPKVVGQGRVVAAPGDRAKSLDRVVERGDRLGVAALGSCGLEKPGLDPASALSPPQDGRLKPQLPFARRVGVFLEEPVEQLDRFRPVAPSACSESFDDCAARSSVRGHLEGQLFAAGEVDRHVLDLAPNRRQVPGQLVVGHGRLGGCRAHGDPQPQSADQREPRWRLR